MQVLIFRRAEQVDQTRQRIVEASVALYGSIGLAATTIAAIADKAGVTRLTVYRNFPDDTALFNTRSAHRLSQQQLPDRGTWSRIGDPIERLRAGLTDLYRYHDGPGPAEEASGPGSGCGLGCTHEPGRVCWFSAGPAS